MALFPTQQIPGAMQPQQPVQQPMQTQTQQRPNFFNSANLLAIAAGLTGGATPQQQVSGMFQNLAQSTSATRAKQEEQAKLNQTRQWLQTQNPEMDLSKLPDAAINTVFSETLKAQYAKKPAEFKVLPNGDYGVWNGSEFKVIGSAPKDQGEEDFNKNPIYGMDADGNTVLLQPGNKGRAIQTQLPEGVKIGKDPIKMETATDVILLDPITRQVIQTIPKNLAQAEQQKAQGKLTGEQLQQLPATLQKADQAITVIDQALSHPGREKTTGWNSTFDPRTYLPGTESADFQAIARQLEGKAFLEAFDSLKGGGQITEVEGKKATEAIARLSTSQSDEAYKQSLLELRGIIEQGKRRAMEQAGQAGVTPQATQTEAAPNVNQTSSGVQWKVK